MKSDLVKMRVAAGALFCALVMQPAMANTPQKRCEDVYRAQFGALDVANKTIANAEQEFKTGLAAARACLEAFGAAAARLTILMGATDLAPVQNLVAQAACNIIQQKASSAVGAGSAGGGGFSGGSAGAGAGGGSSSDVGGSGTQPISSGLVCARTPEYRYEAFPDSPAAQTRRRAAEREAGCVPAGSSTSPKPPSGPGLWDRMTKSILG